MPHLWLKNSEEWNAVRLTGSGVLPLSGPVSDSTPRPADAQGIRMVRVESGAEPTWALIAPPGSRALVNGRAPIAGICVLRDRDEIRTLLGGRCFFSQESLAEIAPFPAAERAVYCGRCRQAIDPGSPVVRCPQCGIVFHQSDELPCWVYSDSCPCGQNTSLNAGFSWVPEE